MATVAGDFVVAGGDHLVFVCVYMTVLMTLAFVSLPGVCGSYAFLSRIRFLRESAVKQ